MGSPRELLQWRLVPSTGNFTILANCIGIPHVPRAHLGSPASDFRGALVAVLFGQAHCPSILRRQKGSINWNFWTTWSDFVYAWAHAGQKSENQRRCHLNLTSAEYHSLHDQTKLPSHTCHTESCFGADTLRGSAAGNPQPPSSLFFLLFAVATLSQHHIASRREEEQQLE